MITASDLGKLGAKARWAKTTKKQRKEHALKMVAAKKALLMRKGIKPKRV
jgi:hypothetical protein